MSEKPEEIAEIIQRDRTFAHDATGKLITRRQTCECGQSFTQMLLSERFMLIVERRGPMALDAMRREVPDYFVPVHCPPCERKDLSMSARRSSYTNYLERPEAAD